RNCAILGQAVSVPFAAGLTASTGIDAQSPRNYFTSYGRETPRPREYATDPDGRIRLLTYEMRPSQAREAGPSAGGCQPARARISWTTSLFESAYCWVNSHCRS